MQRIIDLDKIAPRDIIIVAGGVEYPLPADPPVSVWLPLIDAANAKDTGDHGQDRDNLVEFQSRMLDLFRVRTPDLDALPLGVQAMYTVVIGLYDTDLGEEREAPDPPRRGGTTTSSPRKTPTTPRRKTPTRSRSTS